MPSDLVHTAELEAEFEDQIAEVYQALDQGDIPLAVGKYEAIQKRRSEAHLEFDPQQHLKKPLKNVDVALAELKEEFAYPGIVFYLDRAEAALDSDETKKIGFALEGAKELLKFAEAHVLNGEDVPGLEGGTLDDLIQRHDLLLKTHFEKVRMKPGFKPVKYL